MHRYSKPERQNFSRNRKRCRSEIAKIMKDEVDPKSNSNGRNLYNWRYLDDLPAHQYQKETEEVHKSIDFGAQN